MTRIKAIWNSPNRWIILLIVAVIVVAIVGVISVLLRIQRAATPETPSAFYTPPETLPEGGPGTLIRSEPSTANLPEDAVAYRVMYITTGVNGEEVPVTGTVIAPAGAATEDRPVIAWTHGTTGVLPECGVSHTSDPYQQTPVIERMIDAGYVVTITDYPGLGTPGVHPYIVGTVEANSALDSVRVARQLNVGAGERFAVWGASQGGHAAIWTGQRAAEYELLISKLDDKAGGIFLGYLFYAWADVYADRGASLDDIIRPEARETFERMVSPCFTAPAAFLAVINDVLTPNEYLSVDILETEPWATLIEENTPRDPISVPILIAHGTDDPLIPMELSVMETERRCAAGENVFFQRYVGSVHDAREDTALQILSWMFEGRVITSNCGEGDDA
jgi:acetyl esterase/lipase